MRFSQYLPDLVPHDAISDHVRRLHAALVSAGHEASIHAAHVDHRLRREAQRWNPGSPKPDGVAIYHASTGSPLAGWLSDHVATGGRLVVDHHNITPSRYFARWDPGAAARCRAGRAELVSLAAGAELALADSDFNRGELLDAGYADTATCPLLVDLDAFRTPPELGRGGGSAPGAGVEPLRAEVGLQGGGGGEGASWLFVGRLAPNKCQHDVIAAFALFRRLHDPAARLTLIGSTSSALYRRALDALCRELGVDAAVSVAGGVPHDELLARFRRADVLVCLSEHEGFCVPLLEAMVIGTPVVAYGAAAVPETVGDAGLVLKDKDPLGVADAVAGLLSDTGGRDRLVEAGRRRAENFDLGVSTARWLAALEGLGPSGSAQP